MVQVATRLILAILAAVPALAGAEGCEPPTADSLVQMASRPGVTAVVEHRYLAANPFPWGRSALVVTRVWGDTMVERWEVSDRRSHPCPDVPPLDPGAWLYTFPGSGLQEVVATGPVSGLDAAAIELRYGPARSHQVSGTDRVMAWVRIAPAWVLVGLAAVGLIGSAVARRRRRGREPYLF